MNVKKLLIILAPFAFLVICIYTLRDYGFNSDEPFHFNRGQAYLNYFLTGHKDFKTIKPYPRLKPGIVDDSVSPPFPDDVTEFVAKDHTYEKAIFDKFRVQHWSVWRSFFQYDQFTFNDAILSEDGHPPFGGIVASASNYIFYQRLHFFSDIESYHLAEILVSFVGLIAVSFFVYSNFGVLSAIFAGLSIATYPLFFSESHFNIKDPIETGFFTISIILVYFGVTKRKWGLIIISAISAGFALGTKFNALYLPFIVVPWLLYYSFYFYKNKEKLDRRMFFLIISFILYPVIVLSVFYVMWPYLWPDPINNVQKTISFYKSIGTGTPSELSSYLVNGFNVFPTFWILVTTPLITLALSILGLIFSVISFVKSKNNVYFLLFLWLSVPIIRVSLPGMVIYGGVRQIMEFLIPFGIFAGLGAKLLFKVAKKYFLVRSLLFILIFSLLVYPIYKYHPNENVYFNELVGGLSGASEKNIPFWGNSYGNVYFQGVKWLNDNAEPGARLGLPIATMANVPRLKLRSDISFSNAYWSGTNKGGEYEMEQIYNYPQLSWYSFQYYDTYLNPVYEVKVDGVTLLKVWKNDMSHTKKGFEEENDYNFRILSRKGGQTIFDLGKEVPLTKITIAHGIAGCDTQKGGYISLSKDNIKWNRESEPIDYPQVPPSVVNWNKSNFVFLFPAKMARYVLLDTEMKNSCIYSSSRIIISGLKNLLK